MIAAHNDSARQNVCRSTYISPRFRRPFARSQPFPLKSPISTSLQPPSGQDELVPELASNVNARPGVATIIAVINREVRGVRRYSSNFVKEPTYTCPHNVYSVARITRNFLPLFVEERLWKSSDVYHVMRTSCVHCTVQNAAQLAKMWR